MNKFSQGFGYLDNTFHLGCLEVIGPDRVCEDLQERVKRVQRQQPAKEFGAQVTRGKEALYGVAI